MHLLKVQVNNYKILRAIEVEFGNPTIIIGRNSSGKSNFLEALHLFFNEFTPELTRDVSGVSDHLWHNRETDKPIEFIVAVKLTQREFDQIFTKDLNKFKPAFIEGKLTICREITFKAPNIATWRTRSVDFTGTRLIKDGKLAYKTQNMTEQNKTEILTKVLTNISQRLKNRFKLIFAVRGATSSVPSLEARPLNIPPETQTQIIATFESENLNDLRLWGQIEKDIDGVSSLAGLNVRANELRNREGIIRFPLSYIGGGDQETLALTFMLRHEKAHILAIEEPETHLHPNLSRTFFNILKSVSVRKQTIITTHSPIFIDLVNLNNSWIFRKENRETKVYRIQNAEDLRAVSYELGIKPSDIFFADKILFVEGPIDKTVYGIWAEKLGIDLKSPTISVIPLRGKSKGKRHLQAWGEVTRNVPVSVSLILDKDAKSEADKLIKDKLLTRRQISVLNKGAIEDYYNTTILVTIMKERYSEEFTEDNLKPSQSEGLMKFLKNKHKNWRKRSRAKFEIGVDVATRMSKEQIHSNISQALEKTTDFLELL